MSDNALFKQMDSSLSNYLFKQREDNFVHATLSQEMELFSIVASGDVKTVEKRVARHNTGNLPTLSDDPVRNQQYLFVSCITSCCRFCIEAGMPQDVSYGLSDRYIRRMDKMTDAADVENLYREMMIDYTTRMNDYLGNSKVYSPKILACINYIGNHLHDRITVKELAEEVEMNVSWLSTAFAKEVGVPISTYIRNQKLGAAKYLLEFNDYNISDIAEYLGFAGESHFSTAFRKLTGMTPREYRKANYQKQFTGMAGNT